MDGSDEIRKQMHTHIHKLLDKHRWPSFKNLLFLCAALNPLFSNNREGKEQCDLFCNYDCLSEVSRGTAALLFLSSEALKVELEMVCELLK